MAPCIEEAAEHAGAAFDQDIGHAAAAQLIIEECRHARPTVRPAWPGRSP